MSNIRIGHMTLGIYQTNCYFVYRENSDKVLVFGEVGLSGEVRAVSMAEQRVQEAKKLGFTTVILPAACMKSVGQETEITLIPVENIRDAVRFLEQKR